MRQQYGVDVADRFGADGGTAGLDQVAVAYRVVAGRVKCGIGEQPHPADLEYRGRPAHELDGDRRWSRSGAGCGRRGHATIVPPG
jgi:hypothetical protein